MPYYITSNDWTIRGLAREIADGNANDRPGGRVTLFLGPVYGPCHEPGNMAVWVETNGGPLLLATFDGNAELLWDDAEQDWFGDALGYFDFDGTGCLTHAVRAALEQ